MATNTVLRLNRGVSHPDDLSTHNTKLKVQVDFGPLTTEQTPAFNAFLLPYDLHHKSLGKCKLKSHPVISLKKITYIE